MQEEVMIFDNFQKALYILFSTTLEEETDLKSKTVFIIRWLREHSKEKLAATHACREDFRVKVTNKFLSKAL